MGRWHAEVPTIGVAVFIGIEAQAKLARLESVGASALPTLSFCLNPSDALVEMC